jgi:hypothetical protein
MADTELKAQIIAESDNFVSETEKARDALVNLASSFESLSETTRKGFEELTEHARESESAFESLKEHAMGLVEALGIIEGVHILGEVIGEATEAGEQIKRLSEETGASTESLSRLRSMAEASGTSFESITGALRRTQMELAQLRAGQGSKAIEAALGDFRLTAADLANFPELLEKVSERWNTVGEAARRADVTQLFGRQGLELIPLIENYRDLGEEIDKSAAKLSGPEVEALAQAREEMNLLGATWEAAKEKLIANLVGPLDVGIAALQRFSSYLSEEAGGAGVQAFGVALTGAIVDGVEAINNGLGPVLEKVKTELDDIGNTADKIAHPLDHLWGSVKSIFSSDLSGAANDYILAMGDDAAHSTELIKGLNEQMEAIRASATERVGAPAGGTKGSTGSEAERTVTAVIDPSKLLEEQRKQLENVGASAQFAAAQSGSFGTDQRIAELQAEADYARRTWGEQSTEYEKLQAELLDAEQKSADERTRAEQRAADETIELQDKIGEAVAKKWREAVQAEKEAAEQTQQTWRSISQEIGTVLGDSLDFAFSRAKNRSEQFRTEMDRLALSLMKDVGEGALFGGNKNTLTGMASQSILGEGRGLAGLIAPSLFGDSKNRRSRADRRQGPQPPKALAVLRDSDWWAHFSQAPGTSSSRR